CIPVYKIFHIIIFYFCYLFTFFINKTPLVVSFNFNETIIKDTNAVIFNRNNYFFTAVAKSPLISFPVSNKLWQANGLIFHNVTPILLSNQKNLLPVFMIISFYN